MKVSTESLKPSDLSDEETQLCLKIIQAGAAVSLARAKGEFAKAMLIVIRREDDIPNPRDDGMVTFDTPTPGWSVNPQSVKPQMLHTEGDWEDHGNRSTSAAAAWSFVTVHHGIGTSGKISFILHWREFQNQKENVAESSTTSLLWGDSKGFTLPGNATWYATFTQFNGQSYDISSAQFSSPYLKVQSAGNNVNFVTAPFQTTHQPSPALVSPAASAPAGEAGGVHVQSVRDPSQPRPVSGQFQQFQLTPLEGPQELAQAISAFLAEQTLSDKEKEAK